MSPTTHTYFLCHLPLPIYVWSLKCIASYNEEEPLACSRAIRREHKKVVLNEKASTRVTDSCRCYPEINLANPSIAMNIDWRTEYALGSDHLPIVLSITYDLITYTTPQRTFINFRKADWARYKDNIDLKLKQQQRPINVYHAEKNLRNAIRAAAGRHIPQGRVKTVVAKFLSEAVKFSENKPNSKKISRGPQNNATEPANKQNCPKSKAQKNGASLYKRLLTELTVLNSRSTARGLSSSNAKPLANGYIYF